MKKLGKNSLSLIGLLDTNLLDYQEENQHHARITVDYRSVGIEAYTHNIDSVTELDKKLAKFCDELYEDVTHINKIKIDQE